MNQPDCPTAAFIKRGVRRLPILIVVAVVGLLAFELRPVAAPSSAAAAGPLSALLDASADLGPSHVGSTQLTVTMPTSARPTALIDWAHERALSVRWRPGDTWAVIDGAADRISAAFGVPVHDYRGRHGQVYYASPHQPAVPPPLHDTVTALGRILSYTPHHMSRPNFIPLDVPTGGLGPDSLLTAYNADPLADAGFTGKGSTIVFFAFDGFDQRDLDMYSNTMRLPRFTPVLVGGQPGPPHGETTMDLEVAHAIAPDARLVVVNARTTLEGDGAYEKIGQLFESVDRQFPGAVWSLSIGWGCDGLLTAADLAPVRSALATALSHGTSAFTASGDAGGLECKGRDDWSAPPGPSDIGLNSIASLPEMTSVGGTTLATDDRGEWVAERAWVDSPLSQGSSGGTSALFDRPEWQKHLSVERDSGKRLTPDVSAVADPFTGVGIVYNQQWAVGGGTSQAAPIWAALTTLMNEYLVANGGRPLGDLNPLLYQVAKGADLPGFRDVSDGGNAVDLAAPGYDLVTGLGTPNVDNLVRNLLTIQRRNARR